MRKDAIYDYWHESRGFPHSVVLVTPLWILYEVTAFRLNHGLDGSLRTGVDYLIRICWSELRLPLELSVCLPASFLLLFFSRKTNRTKIVTVRPVFFAVMVLESLFHAAVFGWVVGTAMNLFLTQTSIHVNSSNVAALVINLGSGVFEELVFRVLLLVSVVYLLRSITNRRTLIYVVAVALSSVLFSLFHYLEIFKEVFEWRSFFFRCLAGAAFSILFILRGYGITAYVHSFYNVFLMFRAS